MKSTILNAVLAVSLLTTAGYAMAATRTIRAEVNGMVCAFCAVGIEKRLKALDATKAVYINLERKVVAVELKDGKTLTTAQVVHEIKEAGYDVRKIAESEQSLADIKAAAKGRK